MIVAIYRWRLKPELESQFQAAWRQVTERGLAEFSSGGSALCKLGDGTWMGIARWPDQEALARFRARAPDAEASARMAEAVIESFPALEGAVIDDLWAPISPPA